MPPAGCWRTTCSRWASRVAERFYIIQTEDGSVACGDTLNSTLAVIREAHGRRQFSASFYSVAREHLENIGMRQAEEIIEAELRGMH